MGLLLCLPVGCSIPVGGGAGSGGGLLNSTSIGDLSLPIGALTLVLSNAFLITFPPLIDTGTAPGPGGGWLSGSLDLGLPPFLPNSVKRATYDWSDVEECGPKLLAMHYRNILI